MLDATNQNLQEEKKEEISVKTPQVEGSVSSEKQEESLQKDLKLEEKFDKSTEPQEVRNTASEDTKSELNQVEEYILPLFTHHAAGCGLFSTGADWVVILDFYHLYRCGPWV